MFKTGETIMPFVKVLRHGQVTLPKEFRKMLGIVDGEILEAKLDKYQIILKPKVLLDQESELSAQGEKKIKEALRSLEKGNVKGFDNADDLIKDLNT